MNETVTIKEGGLTRRLAPIDKLKVNTTDNKESMWVPTKNGNTGVLHASENGIYIASEDGYEAYSEVIVRVTKDSFDGDTSFDDWDYETPDMDLDNWDPETIEDFELDPDGFDDVFNNEDEWKDIDKPIDIKMDNPKIKDTKISGIDPVTGNEMEVGLDEDGYLTESTLPSSIKIEIPPDKLQYVEGQPILFRGMVVKAYTADGELWTDGNHPDGVIPHSELTFPVTIAIKPTTSDIYTSSDLDLSPLTQPVHGASREITQIETYSEKNTEESRYTFNGVGAIFRHKKGTVTVIGSKGPSSYVHQTLRNGEVVSEETKTFVLNYTHNDKTVYYTYSYLITYIDDITITPYSGDVDGYGTVVSMAAGIAWTLIYGDVSSGGGASIPVQYIRSDGEVLEDSFTIEVLPDPDGAHPQVDPSTVEWNHRKYKANEDLGAVEVRHGSVYMEGGAIYDVGAAVRLGMLEPVDNEIVP